MYLSLNDHQFKINYCILRMLYMNFKVITNSKPILDTQKINIIIQKLINHKERKRRKEQKRTKKKKS